MSIVEFLVKHKLFYLAEILLTLGVPLSRKALRWAAWNGGNKIILHAHGRYMDLRSKDYLLRAAILNGHEDTVQLISELAYGRRDSTLIKAIQLANFKGQSNIALQLIEFIE